MHNYYLYGLLRVVVLVTFSYVLDLHTYIVEYLETLCEEVLLVQRCLLNLALYDKTGAAGRGSS